METMKVAKSAEPLTNIMDIYKYQISATGATHAENLIKILYI
jgi:hypothetical protein